MMGALEEYVSNQQACIISPFIVGGAMSPVSVAGTDSSSCKFYLELLILNY